ncbi:MAG TPA: HEAT repeat domain-containing protein [Vicinamibacterales bacterium]|nr:HEAT repeat domain-containing protein [Vicinamibacterales bacterium]
MKTRHLIWLVAAVAAHAACMGTPPPKLPEAPAVPERQKTAWILQLEDQRILRLEPPAEPPPPPPVKGKKPARVVPPPPPPSSSPDLAVLIRDAQPRVRRRAALAIGRVKDRAGAALLMPALNDAEPEVRAMAAFALGLLGDASSESALTPLLNDASPLVRGRAAEALGLCGAKGGAAAIGQMVAEYAKSAAVAGMQPDDESTPIAPEAEAFKLGLFALVRLGAYDAIAAAVLANGQPVSAWWPIAYALQRVEDTRAAPALVQLLAGNGRYTRAFAARGLGRLKERSAVKPLLGLLDPAAKPGREVVVSAVRALGQIGAPEAAAALARIAGDPSADPNVRLDAVAALGELRSPDGLPVLQDLMTDEWPAMRAAAIRAAAAADAESFIAVIASLGQDSHWRVRAAMAEAFASLPADAVGERLRSMLQDEDKRVIPAVLTALGRLKAPDLREILMQRIEDPDYAVRAAAARGLGILTPEGGAEALRKAYQKGVPDITYSARAAALEALAAYGAAEAAPTLREALADKDWALRVRALELLTKLDPAQAAAAKIAPVPSPPIAPYDSAALLEPPTSPHVFIETAYGTIEFELAVVDAPQTSRNFMELARKGFFNGLEVHRVVANFVVQDGDPRGDGGGGPGYTIRDELNERPYLRGTVGMALEWRDTGGSQFFITHSPQPHLDARYTAFGHVVNGIEAIDRIKPGDVIQRVRVWDGNRWLE